MFVFFEYWLVFSTNLKNISQNGKFPTVGAGYKNVFRNHLAKGKLIRYKYKFKHISSLGVVTLQTHVFLQWLPETCAGICPH